MFEKFRAIHGVGQKIRGLRANAVFGWHIKLSDQMLPFRQRVFLVELKEPPGVTDVRVPAFEREIDPCQFSERALPRSEAMNEGTEAKHPRKQTPYFVSFTGRFGCGPAP